MKQRGGNDGNIPESRPEGENGNIVKLGPDGNDGNILRPEGNDSNIPLNLIMHTVEESKAMEDKTHMLGLDYHFFYINSQQYYTDCIKNYTKQYTDNQTLTWNQFLKNEIWNDNRRCKYYEGDYNSEITSMHRGTHMTLLEEKLKKKIIIVPRIKTGDKQPYSPYIFFADYIYFKNGKRLLPGLVSVNVEIIKQKFDAINDISNDRDRYSDRQDKIYGMERIEKKYKTNTLLKKYFQET